MKRKPSLVLIPAIILIVFAAIAVLGLSFFILENSQLLLSQEAHLKSLYISEAGIQEAIYWFKKQGYFTLGTYNVTANEHYILDPDTPEAYLLLVDTKNTQVVEKKTNDWRLKGLKVKDVTNTIDLTITQMLITWPNTSAKLKEIKIGKKRTWKDNASSPAVCLLTNSPLIKRRKKKITLKYDKDPSSGGNGTISIKFTMDDGSATEVIDVYPPSPRANFTVRSQGLVIRDSGNFSTTIEAEYNDANSTIVSYKKTQ